MLSLIILGIGIVTLVISIEAYINISKKYDMSSAWFIVGCFISPVMLVAYIILYNKVRKIKSNNIDLIYE